MAQQPKIGINTQLTDTFKLSSKNYTNWVTDITPADTQYKFRWKTEYALGPTNTAEDNSNAHNSTAIARFTVNKSSVQIAFMYDIITENNYDKLTVYRKNSNNEILNTIISGRSGTENSITNSVTFYQGDIIELKYEKDGSKNATNEKCNIQMVFNYLTEEYQGIANSINKIYIGVDNIARLVKKIFIGDENGIARLSYSNNVTLTLRVPVFCGSITYYVTPPADTGIASYSQTLSSHTSGATVTYYPVVVPYNSSVRFVVGSRSYWPNSSHDKLGVDVSSSRNPTTITALQNTELVFYDNVFGYYQYGVYITSDSTVQRLILNISKSYVTYPNANWGYNYYIQQGAVVTYTAIPKSDLYMETSGTVSSSVGGNFTFNITCAKSSLNCTVTFTYSDNVYPPNIKTLSIENLQVGGVSYGTVSCYNRDNNTTVAANGSNSWYYVLSNVRKGSSLYFARVSGTHTYNSSFYFPNSGLSTTVNSTSMTIQL